MTVQPYLSEDCVGDEWELGRFPTRMMKKRVDEDTIQGTMGGTPAGRDITWVLETPSPGR